MISGISKFVLIAALSLGACSSNPADPMNGTGDNELLKYDESNFATDRRHIMRVATNIDFEDDLRYWHSKIVDDVDCERYHVSSSFPLKPGEIEEHKLNFSRQGSPTRALYEWHICFVIEDVVYRAWRGFDPGPGTDLVISCFIDQDQIARKDTSKYLCQTDHVSQNFGNHTEYIIHCWEEDSCKSFDTEEDFLKWTSINPLSREDLLQIAVAILEDQLSKGSYISVNHANYYLSVGGEDPPLELLERFSTESSRFYPASEFEQHGALNMTMEISKFEQVEEGVAEGSYGTYCGPLCASGHTVVVEKVNGNWKIRSIVMDWIS